MTKERAKQILPLIQAYSEGKQIQLNDKSYGWTDISDPNFDAANVETYRIKPEFVYRKYSIEYCSISVPTELSNSIPVEFKSIATDEYARLKDGIEVTFDNLYEFINNSEQDFKAISSDWQNFLKECIKIKCDSYVFHS